MINGAFVSGGQKMHGDRWKLKLLIITNKEDAVARTPIHPGEILADELEETGLTAKKLAGVIEVPPNRLYQLLAGKRNMTADTALRLSQYFGMSADFWMNLQSAYELDIARRQNGKAIRRLPKRNDVSAEPRPVI
ncbi:MAG: HigA family addiction module antitoxin [Bryobacteraceae bacterium]